MAKLNPIFGRMRGKLGGAVYYSSNGKQCVRERVIEVANPRTSKQAIQRAIFATLAQFTSAFSPVLNNAVEGMTGKTKNLSKLNAYNLGILRRIAAESLSGGAFTPKGSKVIAPNEYLISRGSLRGISPFRDRDAHAALSGGALQFLDTDLVLGENLTASQMFPTIAVGDQITILAAWLEDFDAGSYSGYCRFAFKNDTTPALVVDSGSIYKLNEAAIDLTKAAGPWRALRFTAGTTVRNNILVGGLFGGNADDNTDMAGIIVSRESKRKRSTAYMVAVSPFPGYTLEEVYPTYMDGGTAIDMPSEVYLNNDSQRGTTVSPESRYKGYATVSAPELPFTFVDQGDRLIVLTSSFEVPSETQTLGIIKFTFNGVEYESPIEVDSAGSSVGAHADVEGVESSIQFSGLNAQGPTLTISLGSIHLAGLTVESINLNW